MPDESLDEKAEEDRERRNKRIARVRREIKSRVDPILVPYIVATCAALQFAFPIGIALFAMLLLVYGLIAYLTILPQLRVSARGTILTLAGIAVSLALLVSGLGDTVELLGAVLLSVFIMVVLVHCANAVKAERQKNPD